MTRLIYLQDGALKLSESLFNGFQDFVKLDFSYCGLTSKYALGLNNDIMCSIVELNLAGNPILLEVCSSSLPRALLHKIILFMQSPIVSFLIYRQILTF